MFKKTAIAALVLGFSGAASAALYAPAPAPACAAGNVTVPCERSAWDLGLDLLYIKTDLSSASIVPGFKARYGWGFNLEGSYHYGTGNDATVSWAHYNRGTGVNLGTMFRSSFDWVNLEMAQQVDVSEVVSLRFHGGVHWVSALDNSQGGPTTVGSSFRFNGFGPRAGVKATYDLSNGFAVYGDTSVGMAIGKAKARTNGVTPGGAVVAGNTFYGSVFTHIHNVGVQYTHAMAQGDLTARLGWGGRGLTSGFYGDDSWSGINFGLKWVGNV